MKALLIVVAVCLCASAAQAESCTKSREYILAEFAGELPQPPANYRSLFDTCVETLGFANVKDAFLLVDGGIAVIPKHDTVPATAGTLAEFCRQFPNGTLRFLTRNEIARRPVAEKIVRISSTNASSCKKIRGAE